MNCIKSQLNQLFNNCPMNYQQLFIFSFSQMMDLLMGLENNQISLDNYNQAIKNFMLQVLNNNSNNNIKDQPRPIMIFYMISSILKMNSNNISAIVIKIIFLITLSKIISEILIV